MITNIMELADAYAEAYRWQTIAGYKQARAALLAEVERVSKNAQLGRIAMRFVDRAGDYCDIDPAERICDQFYKAMSDQVTARDAAMKGTS
ncbi:MAG: hypothetical protein WC829_09910 [Hyphomicrobium sp.]|jgi:hypothetical protein